MLYLYLPYKHHGKIEVKGLLNKVHRAWVVGSGQALNYKLYNHAYWSSTPGNLYIDVPDEVLDPQITVIALLLDGPAKIYKGSGLGVPANYQLAPWDKIVRALFLYLINGEAYKEDSDKSPHASSIS